MTKDDIIRMAREADILETDCYDNEVEVEAFANLVAAAEREECAKLLENTDLSGLKNNPSVQNFIAVMLSSYAAAIRARGNT